MQAEDKIQIWQGAWKEIIIVHEKRFGLLPDDDFKVSHGAPRFKLDYHSIWDIWSVFFSRCKMNITVLDVDVDVENIGLAYIPCTLKENSGITLKGSGFYMCFTDLFRTTCALSRN